MDHLALKVSDQERARRFYEAYCGFGAQPARRYDDDTLMLYDARGFSLALGVEIVEQWDEPDYVSVKCRDPDGHIVEFSWETA
jgi:catechol 2,3-dioxygenase-like lactoylglutathione lyase family enzyme